MDNLSKRLTIVRLLNELTKADVAKALDITPQVYGRYELGQREPSLEIIAKLSNFYQISTDYFIFSHKEVEHNQKSEMLQLIQKFEKMIEPAMLACKQYRSAGKVAQANIKKGTYSKYSYEEINALEMHCLDFKSVLKDIEKRIVTIFKEKRSILSK